MSTAPSAVTELKTPRGKNMLVGRLVIGEPFNPWHKACGFYPPDVVGRRHDLTDGQKRLYERAVRWSGRNGTFWRSFETIAEELGKSLRQVKSDVAALENAGLITHVRRGNRKSNVYTFLWHLMFESEVQRAAHQKTEPKPVAKMQTAPCSEVQDLPSEVQSNVKSEVQPTALEFSQLLSCVQNCVQNPKADYSRRLAKTDESPAGHVLGVVDCVDKNPKADSSTDAGDATQSTDGAERSQNAELLSQKAKPEELVKLRAALIAYMGGIPPDGFENSCLLRGRGASVADIVDLINRRWKAKKHRPGASCGPRTWNWFLTVIANEFSPAERGRSPEAVATPHPDHRTSVECLARGIQALETNPADSLVSSYRCKCGADIRQYETRIEGMCTCASRRKQPNAAVDDVGLSRAAAGGAR